MSLSIAQLYRQDENKYKLDLLAGRRGLSRDVAWVQVMEDADYGTFCGLTPSSSRRAWPATATRIGWNVLLLPCWQPMRPGWSSIRKVPLAVGYYGSLERTL